jgi:hypothetical protein
MSSKLRNILVALSLLVAGAAHAQTFDTTEPVQYLIAPETPGPHAPVTITAQGVGSFLGDATVTWTLNGAVAKQGIGASDFSFTTGNLGVPSVVKLTIDSATQGTIVHTFTLTPSVINLVWEADTSAPPLYAGHALYSAGSPLRVVAFPTVVIGGTKVAAQSLSYQWSVNDTALPQSSGTGKYVLSVNGDQLQDNESVAVDVYLGSAKVGHGEVVIPTSQPQLVLYDKDPLRGVLWDQALPASIALNATELTVLAQPYFFATNAVASGAIQWTWALNDSPVTGPDTSRGILTLRQTGAGQGAATLAVAAQNQASAQLIQSAQAALSIVFGQARSGFASFFGL